MSRSACQLCGVERVELGRLGAERQRRVAAAAGDADGQVRPGRHRRGGRAGLQEHRRQAGIGGRRHPGLHHRPWRGGAGRQGGPGGGGETVERVRPGHHQCGDQGDAEQHAQGRSGRVPPSPAAACRREAGRSGRAGAAGAAPRPARLRGCAVGGLVLQRGERAVAQAGRPLQPAVDGVGRGGRTMPQPAPRAAPRRPAAPRRGRATRSDGGRKAGRSEQRRRGERADQSRGRPGSGPELFEPQNRPRHAALAPRSDGSCGPGGPALGHPSQSGTCSSAHIASSGLAGRMVDHRPASTMTSAANGRAL